MMGGNNTESQAGGMGTRESLSYSTDYIQVRISSIILFVLTMVGELGFSGLRVDGKADAFSRHRSKTCGEYSHKISSISIFTTFRALVYSESFFQLSNRWKFGLRLAMHVVVGFKIPVRVWLGYGWVQHTGGKWSMSSDVFLKRDHIRVRILLAI